MVGFSAKQFKNFSCLTETEARNMNRLLNCFVEGGARNISNKRKYRTGDEEGRGKVGKKSDLKRKKSWSAQQEYIWKLTTKLPKLCERLKKDFKNMRNQCKRPSVEYTKIHSATIVTKKINT